MWHTEWVRAAVLFKQIATHTHTLFSPDCLITKRSYILCVRFVIAILWVVCTAKFEFKCAVCWCVLRGTGFNLWFYFMFDDLIFKQKTKEKITDKHYDCHWSGATIFLLFFKILQRINAHPRNTIKSNTRISHHDYRFVIDVF